MRITKHTGTLALAAGVTLRVHLVAVTLFTGEDYETTVCEEDEEGEQFPRYQERFTCESLSYSIARVDQIAKKLVAERAIHAVVVERNS